MAKITITLEDGKDGSVACNVKFDPEIETDEPENLTDAQRTGLAMLMHAFPPDREGVNWNARQGSSDAVDQ